MARGKKKEEKSSKAFWAVLGIVIVAIGFLVWATGGASASAQIDPTQYDYTDDLYASPDAEAVVEKFSDFECPFCGSTAPALEQAKRDPSIRVDYRHFPLSFHPNAQMAAEASECARDQNRFWAFHDVIFDNQERITVNDLKSYAQQLGFDMEAFNACVDNREKQTVVAEDVLEGRSRGVQATPTLFINGEVYEGQRSGPAIVQAALN